MKDFTIRGIIIFAFSFSPLFLLSQSTPSPVLSYLYSGLNMTINLQAQRPFSSSVELAATSNVKDVIQQIQYTDGLGRPVQSVIKDITPSGKNMYDQNLYDSYGREVTKYLPTPYAYSKAYVDQSALTSIGNSFNSGLYPGESDFYSKLDFENSPLNRVTKVYAQGSSWVGGARGISQQNLVNTASDGVRIWNIALTQGALPTSTQIYGAGQLYKVIKTDEQSKQVITYSDKNGQKILVKQQLSASGDNSNGSPHTGWICTYYVYDDYGNMRFIITPKAIAQIDGTWTISKVIADGLCYRMEYDLKNNVIIRKTPGIAEQWFVYDARNRLVMAQDGNLRAQHKWEYFQFDAQDRPTTHGLLTDASHYNSLSFHSTNAAISISYPALSAYPTELLTQTYYDDYTWTASAGMPGTIDQSSVNNTSYFYFPSNTTYPYPQQIAQTAMTYGVVTGHKSEVLGSNSTKYLYSVNFYDDKGRTTQTVEKNITGGLNKVTLQYSWVGKNLRKLEQYQYSVSGHSQSHTILTKYAYDDVGRLLAITKRPSSTVGSVTINGTDKTIVHYSYDELGRIKQENLGQLSDTAHPVERRLYEYNVRGWLSGINRAYTRDVSQASNIGCGECFVTPPNPKPAPGNFFGFDLGYDKLNNSLAGGATYTTAQYTGNITGTVWKSANDEQVRKYDYAYDGANRFTGALFNQFNGSSFNTTAGIDYSVSNIAYDMNGNLMTMSQKGLKTLSSSYIDQLTYNYLDNSNQLKYVVDNANDAGSNLGDFHYDAVSKTSSTVDYNYDANGNVLLDQNKHLTMAYNFLNLPDSIVVTSLGTISYSYDASGRKLQKIIVDKSVTPYKTTTYNYIDEFLYKNDTLQSISDEVGRLRIKASTNRFVYDYYLTDNQGNTRMVITDDTTQTSYILEAMNYYPFGLEMNGIDTKSTGLLHNNYNYQGKELQNTEFANGKGLDLYDFDSRFYDHQLGLWHSPDGAGQFASPYIGMGNNWPNGTDPDGQVFGIDDILIGAAIGALISSSTYVAMNFATGGSWNDLNLKKGLLSAGMGALGGALGAASTQLGTILGGAFSQSFGYNFMSNMAIGTGLDLAFGHHVTFGSVLGSMAGSLVDASMPNFRGFSSGEGYSFADGVVNALGEIGYNEVKGGISGAVSGFVGAEIDHRDIAEGVVSGIKTGLIGGGVRTVGNIAILGPTIRPNKTISTQLKKMETDLGIKLIDDPYGPVYRTGGLWQRGLSVGISHSIAYGDGSIMAGVGKINDVQTWIHESYHYFQLLNQGWYGQLSKGFIDQFFTPDPYNNSNTNEFPATQYQSKYSN